MRRVELITVQYSVVQLLVMTDGSPGSVVRVQIMTAGGDHKRDHVNLYKRNKTHHQAMSGLSAGVDNSSFCGVNIAPDRFPHYLSLSLSS
eukprot:scaffold1566_cov185-Ochromonas_danica.AAC.3